MSWVILSRRNGSRRVRTKKVGVIPKSKTAPMERLAKQVVTSQEVRILARIGRRWVAMLLFDNDPRLVCEQTMLSVRFGMSWSEPSSTYLLAYRFAIVIVCRIELLCRWCGYNSSSLFIESFGDISSWWIEKLVDCRGDSDVPSEKNRRRSRRFRLEEEVSSLWVTMSWFWRIHIPTCHQSWAF